MKKAYTLLACTITSVFFSSMIHAESTAQVSPRIINGSDATLGEWPSIVALVTRGQNAFDGQFCGGSFLGDRYVLTAAHCVDFRDPTTIDVVIGINNLNNEASEGVRVPVRRIYIHEDYVDRTLLNDIAILELDRAVVADQITLAAADARVGTAVGTTLKVAGWGTTSPSGRSNFPSVLQQVEVDLIDQAVCQTAMREGISSMENSANFCAGRNNQDSCRGDSGGPIIVTSTGAQLGIVSWGGPVCALNNTYGVYTNVSYFADWITQKTRGFSYQQQVDKQQVRLAPFTHTFTYNNLGQNSLTYSALRLQTVVGMSVTPVANNCQGQTLNPNESCDITLQFNPQIYRNYQYNFEIDFLENGVARTANSTVKFHSMRNATAEVMSVLSSLPKTEVLTSEQGWTVVGNELRSGAIGDSQQSELVIKGIPRGTLSFNYRISSEPDFDKLEVYLNGQQLGSTSGSMSRFQRLVLPNTSNTLEFRYVKDGAIASGEDAAFISNLGYSSGTSIDNPTTVIGGESVISETTSAITTSSSGGSIGWLGLLLCAPLLMRRKNA
ncbi:trypsin-like serine protease [Vibrio cholerae]|uniref:S1 family peptidase n=1 Tax=Vibrio cholerae TaxID=666 RepID=UPI00226F2816|nr:trypsin-like serine protease [Vibrio cholerae]EGR3956869.1 trypsin-like serine protease [Vibrio cholerae]EGR4196550.1 trypsin-like serine protease [Vibrio cholerae]EKG0017768.1 trypsin-like serine protease [Vibrio cholerae]ELA3030779.1 trypsin-like serine protease [Vibrio cholerae]ELN7715977.1 trypsin-like serine protease [Vibrio cholerae]